jgi:hypothetical protein
VKSAAPRRDPIVKNIMYVVGGLILAGVAYNVLGGLGLINGVSRSGPGAQHGFQVSGTIHTRTIDTAPGHKDIADLSGTVTNNTGQGCARTEIVGTMFDQAGSVVSVAVAANVATDSGQTVQWTKSVPYVAETNTITHATWAALCAGNH